jgi:hypothetical protein
MYDVHHSLKETGEIGDVKPKKKESWFICGIATAK